MKNESENESEKDGGLSLSSDFLGLSTFAPIEFIAKEKYVEKTIEPNSTTDVWGKKLKAGQSRSDIRVRNITKLSVPQDGNYIISLDEYNASIWLYDSDFKYVETGSHPEKDKYSTSILSLKSGEYYLSTYNGEREYSIYFYEEKGITSISISSQPNDKKIVDNNGSTYFSLAGLAIEVEYADESKETVSYGSNKWNQFVTGQNLDITKKEYTLSFCNGSKATVSGYVIADISTVAVELPLDGSAIDFDANWIQYEDHWNSYGTHHFVSVTVENEDNYTFNLATKDGKKASWEVHFPDDGENFSDDNFGHTSHLTPGKYYLTLDCSSDFTISVSKSEFLQNVSYNIEQDVFIEKYEDISIYGVTITAYQNEQEISIEFHDNNWYLYNFDYSIREKTGKYANDYYGEGSYDLIFTSPCLEEPLVIPVEVKPISYFVEASLTTENNVDVEGSSTDVSWIEINVEESGSYIIHGEIANRKIKVPYIYAYLYDENLEYLSSIDAVAPKYEFENTVYLSAGKTYLKYRSKASVTLKLIRISGIASMSISANPNRDTFYSVLDSYSDNLLMGLELHLVFDDESEKDISYSTSRQSDWFKYGLSINANYNNKTTGQKKVTITAPSKEKVEVLLNYVDRSNVSAAITPGQTYEKNYSNNPWIKINVTKTGYYTFLHYDTDSEDDNFEDCCTVYGITNEQLDTVLSGWSSTPIKLTANREYYISDICGGESTILVKPEKNIKEIVSINFANNKNVFVENIDSILPNSITVKYEDNTLENIAIGNSRLKKFLYDSSNKDLFEEIGGFFYEDYKLDAGVYRWKINSIYNCGIENVSANFDIEVKTIDEVECQILGEPIVRKAGEEIVLVKAPEDAIYELDYSITDGFDADYFYISNGNATSGITRLKNINDVKEIIYFKKGVYLFTFDDYGYFFNKEISFNSNKLSGITSWEFVEGYDLGKCLKQIPSHLGENEFSSYLEDIRVHACFEDGTEKDIYLYNYSVDSLENDILSSYFKTKVSKTNGDNVTESDSHATGDYILSLYPVNNNELLKSVHFEVVSDDEYYKDNIITLDKPSALKNTYAILSIDEAGYYSLSSEGSSYESLWAYLYLMHDGNVFYEDEWGEWSRNSRQEFEVCDVSKTSYLNANYLDAGDYLVHLNNLYDCPVILRKYENVESISINGLPQTGLMEVGIPNSNVEVNLTYSDGTKQTVDYSLTDLYDIGSYTGVKESVTVSLENDTIDNKSWIKTGWRARLLYNSLGNIDLDTVSDSYYWLVKDKVKNTTVRIPLKIDTVNNYNKNVLTESNTVTTSIDENLGYGIIPFTLQKDAPVKMTYHKNDVNNSFFMLGYPIVNVEDKEVFRTNTADTSRYETDFTAEVVYAREDRSPLKAGNYFLYVCKTDFGTDGQVEVSMKSIPKVIGLTNVLASRAVHANVYMEGDAKSDLGLLNVMATVLYEDDTTSQEYLVVSGNDILINSGTTKFDYEIVRKDGQAVTYGYGEITDVWNLSYEDETLVAGEYSWNIYSLDGERQASIDFSVAKIEDALNYSYNADLSITDYYLTNLSSFIWRKVTIPEGKKYKITPRRGICTLQIISDKLGEDNSVTKKLYTYYGQEIQPFEVVLGPGEYVMRGMLGNAQITDVSPQNLDKVTNLSLAQNQQNVDLSWNGVSNAVKYEILVSKDGGDYTTLATITDGSTSYSDTSAKENGSTYSYKVRALGNEVNGEFSDSKEITFVGSLTKPSIKSVSFENDQVKLTWDAIANATGYEIFVSIDGGQVTSLGKIEDGSITEFTHSNVTLGKNNKYTIKAYNSLFESEVSEGQEIFLYEMPEKPAFTSINQQEKDVHILWSESTKATAYEIQISINGGEYASLATISDGSCNYVDESEKAVGSMYKYRIKATNPAKESDYAESEEFTYLGSVLSPVISAVTSVETGIKIEWNQVENAEGYYIFVSQDGTDFEQIEVINDASVTEYITENKVLGNSYIYAVKAFNKAYTSSYSNQGSVDIPEAPSRPAITEIKQIEEKIKVTWTESVNATKYELQLSVNSAPYVTLATITDGSLEYFDSSEKTAGASYRYRIRGINSETESTYSEVVSIIYIGTITSPELSIDKTETSVAKLTWNKVDNSTGYEVYASADGGEYLLLTKIENAGSTEYIHEDMKAGKTYSYKVKAYNSIYTSELSNEIQACLAGKTAVSALTATGDGIEISWKKVSKATGYEILKKTGNGSYETLATITSGAKEKYEDTKVSFGKTYTYQIKTISGHLVSQAGTADSIKYITSTKVTSGGSKCMTASISWKKVSGANEYNIYRKTGKEDYKLIKTVKSSVLKYDDSDKDLKAGTKYSYVVAAKSGDSVGIKSSAVEIKIVDHNYSNKVSAATATKDGKITSTCKTCKHKETEKIPAAKKIEISATEVTYTGKALKPAITIATSKGVAIDKKYYSISYSDNKAIGTATATIKFTGNYTGTIKKTFKILPAQTKLTKLTGASKAFTAGISAGKGADGYEIYYSTSDKFKSVYKKLNKKSVKSVTFKKLKAKTKYYVKVRSYKAVKEKGKTVNYYSDWSPVLTVITK